MLQGLVSSGSMFSYSSLLFLEESFSESFEKIGFRKSHVDHFCERKIQRQ